MEKTLDVIEDLQKKGLINQYAIGGGIAAIFYLERLERIMEMYNAG